LIRCLVRVHVYFYWELLFCYDVFIYLKMNSAKNKFRFLFLRAAVVSYIPTFIFFLLSALTGLIMYAYFEGCDPMKAGTIERPDQMIPLLVIKVFQDIPGMAGLFVSAAVSGALRYCCDRKSRAACPQSFAPWQQATIEIMLAISLTVACSHYISWCYSSRTPRSW